MKKMMVALAVVVLATIAQAGAFKWSTSMGQAIYAGNATDKVSAGTAYLFDANTYAVATLLDAFVGTGIDYSKAISNKGVSSTGTIAATTTDQVVADQSYSLYFAIVSGDDVFVSDYKVLTGPSGDKTTNAAFSPSTASKIAAAEWTAGGTYSASGWYTAAVPEPTSGLLMLLGMAGLALRRRRA